MKEGDLALAALPQAGGAPKLRPVVLLRRMPPFGDFLVGGVSTQLRHAVAGFDEVLRPTDADFFASGLKAASLIRLGFLAVVPASMLTGRIGALAPERHRRLLDNLRRHLLP